MIAGHVSAHAQFIRKCNYYIIAVQCPGTRRVRIRFGVHIISFADIIVYITEHRPILLTLSVSS